MISPYEVVKMMSRLEKFTPRDLEIAAHMFRIPTAHMVSAAWDMCGDGELTYNARAEFHRVRSDDDMEVGDKVKKPDGYPFPGTVVAAFETLGGKKRYVVESELAPGMLHIMAPSQLEKEAEQ